MAPNIIYLVDLPQSKALSQPEASERQRGADHPALTRRVGINADEISSPRSGERGRKRDGITQIHWDCALSQNYRHGITEARRFLDLCIVHLTRSLCLFVYSKPQYCCFQIVIDFITKSSALARFNLNATLSKLV